MESIVRRTLMVVLVQPQRSPGFQPGETQLARNGDGLALILFPHRWLRGLVVGQASYGGVSLAAGRGGPPGARSRTYLPRAQTASNVATTVDPSYSPDYGTATEKREALYAH